MNSSDLLKLYRDRARQKEAASNPLGQMLSLEEHVDQVMESTYEWYLERDAFASRRLVYEIRNLREKLLEFQLVIEGIALAEGGKVESE